MANRDATDTITGYFYQFDKTILEILNQDHLNTQVQVEGVEDIDVCKADKTKAIQCKYYAKSEYNHSEIKKPIALMVKHFSKTRLSGATTNYYLYGHYKSGQEKLGEINVNILKNKFLTSKKTKDKSTGEQIEIRVYDELGLDDGPLQEFLDRLTIDINAPSLDKQYAEIIQKIVLEFKVTETEAELYYYKSALKVIRDLAVQQNKKDRIITKRQFIKEIKAQETTIFDAWFMRRKGRESYIKSMKKQFLSSGLNIEPFERFFLIDCSGQSNTGEIKDIIYSIARKWSKTSKREPKRFCPAIYLHGLDADVFHTLKKEMYTEGQFFVDGYPFLGAELSPNHFYTIPGEENKIKFRIVSSYADFRILIDDSAKTIEVYEFYIDGRIFESESTKHIAIKIEDLSYVKEMMQ